MESRRAAALVALLAGACTTLQPSPVARLEQDLAAQPSATAVLQARCHPGGTAVAIRAEQVAGAPPALHPSSIRRLTPAPGEPMPIRHVRLKCGETTLSEAYNWYLPKRLPAEAAARLSSSDTPFGKVLAPYGFTRTRLWSRRGRASECPPGTVLSQSAVLELPGKGPISLVIECYTAASL